MPLRILHISTRLILGGSQENTVLSCEGQTRLGHDVHLAHGPIFGPEGSLADRVRAFRTADDRGITLHELPSLVREIHPLKDHRCLHHDLKQLLKHLRPDIVHTHSSKAGILGRCAAWRAQYPVGQASRLSTPACTPHPQKPTGGTPVPPMTTPRPAVIHTIHGPPFMPDRTLPTLAKNALYTIAERFAAKRCHTIVSVADAMTTQFLARNIGTPEQYTTVRSGMELDQFLTARDGEDRASMRRELGIADRDFVIGTVARLAQHKGHDDILDALADDLRARPAWKLLWIGDGWWKDRLLARVESLGLSRQLITTGLVPQDRVPAMMRTMDVLAHPSYREGLPRTVPQALLCGACPVAYDVDGTGEICRDGETGRLVPLADKPALRRAILDLAENPHDRARMVEKGRDIVVREFSAEAMVTHLEDVYRRALKKR